LAVDMPPIVVAWPPIPAHSSSSSSCSS